jgi:hypothetical protein
MAAVGARRTTAPAPTYAINEESSPILLLAAVQARELGHGFVGAAHLLLSILADSDTRRRGFSIATGSRSRRRAKRLPRIWPTRRLAPAG